MHSVGKNNNLGSIICLIGLPGSGKSTIGKQLAETLEAPFFDLDILIEAKEGRSIRDIIQHNGEEYFRKAEAEILKATIPQKGAVIATGGGTPCFEGNMAWMLNYGIVVYLEVSPVKIAARLQGQNLLLRPLLHTGEVPLVNRLQQLLKERVAYYQQATYTVTATDLNPEQITGHIYSLLQKV